MGKYYGRDWSPGTFSTPTVTPAVSTEKTKAQLLFEGQEYETILGAIPENPQKRSNMLVFGNGVYLMRQNIIGKFIRKVNDANLPGIGNGPEPTFELHLPKIPVDILRQQVCFYRKVMDVHQNAESYTMILWDKEDQKYIVVCPKQKISRGNVQYDLGFDYPSTRYIQVVSCHSHNTMGAFFSGTDDADEKGDMCYMVMGELNKPVPAFKIRASLAGKEVKSLRISDLFDITDEVWSALSPAWIGDFFPTDWLGMLNVEANYISIHAVQGGSSSGGPFRYGTFDASGRYQQLSFENYAGYNTFGDESRTYRSRTHTSGGTKNQAAEEENVGLRAIAHLFLADLKTESAADCLALFLERVIDAGYADDLEAAFADESVAEAAMENYDSPPLFSMGWDDMDFIDENSELEKAEAATVSDRFDVVNEFLKQNS